MTIKKDIFVGCAPALMTPCTAQGSVDSESMVATAQSLIHAGMRAVVYCGSMGDWPLLDDADRMRGVEALVDGGVPTVVGTGAQCPRRARKFAAHAEDVGAAGLMVIPRVLSRGSSQTAQRIHFADVLRAAPNTPSVIYNSPYYGFETTRDLFFDLRADHPNLIGFKEFGGRDSLSYAAQEIIGVHEDLSLLVGVDTQVFHGIVRCCADGVITGVGNALPIPILRFTELCRRAAKGDAASRRYALELDAALSVLATFDEGPDLVLFYKHLMVLEGHHEYQYSVEPTDALSASQRCFIEAQWHQFRNWWSDWPGRAD